MVAGRWEQFRFETEWKGMGQGKSKFAPSKNARAAAPGLASALRLVAQGTDQLLPSCRLTGHNPLRDAPT